MKTSLSTRLICAFLCVCMLLPMFASCSKVKNNSANNSGGSSSNTPGGGTPGGDTPGGDTETTYYKVSFAVALEEFKSRVTLPNDKLYEAGTEIQYLPTPGVRDLLFMGWYYDAAMTRPVALTDKVNSDLMLYAKLVDTSGDIEVVEGVYYHTVYDVESDYTFLVKADSLSNVQNNITVENISSAGKLLELDTDYTISDAGDGRYRVSVNYKPGKTYRVNLSAGAGLNFCVDGADLSEQVTTLNVLVAKEEVSNLQLSDGLIYIPRNEVDLSADAPNGLVAVSDSGATINSGDIGYFTYEGATLKSGDRVAIYEGDIPSERDFYTNNGAVKYLTVTGYEGNNIYKYRVSDSKEVLFIPDIIPISGKTNAECAIKIPAENLDFSGDVFKQLGMNEDTKIEAGDYIAFFDGPMAEGTDVEYAKIESVSRDSRYYYIDYKPVSYDDVIASMDVFQTRTETPELSDAQIEKIKKQVYNDAIDSGFVEEAADYLVNLYVSSNGLETMPNGTTVRYYPKMRASARSGDSGLYYEVTKCEAVPDVKVGEGVLKHFEDSNGIRVELTLSFEIEFTVGEEGKNKVVISAEAVFEEEILLSINVEGGAVWETAWIFPYIADYEMNANIDIGTYTGVSAIAKVYTNNGEEKEEEEEEDDSFFPDFDLDKIGEGDSYEDKAKNIGEELKKLFELNDNIKEEIEGEGEEDDTGNDITEKYAEMMKDANETWIEIVRVEIYKQSQNLDQFGILWFEIGIDFVVSAQLYIMAGIEVETGVAKRYNFSVTLFERSVKTDVIDLEKAHFSFKFYVMGTAGLKVGFEVELSLALLSSDVASVGVSAELGVSLGIWGYFYFSYEKEVGEEPEIQKAGAMFFEIGVYVEVKFKAHLFNIEKLTYNPTLYENLWPIYSVGHQENVFEFEDYSEKQLTFTMQGKNTLVLPNYIFRMKYLDLKDGKFYAGTSKGDDTPSKVFDDDTESRFLIEISDPRFTYDPETNTLSTTVDVENMTIDETFDITITLTYKHGALAFNQDVISRDINVTVKNDKEYKYVDIVHLIQLPDVLGYFYGPAFAVSESFPFKMGSEVKVSDLPIYGEEIDGEIMYGGYKFSYYIYKNNELTDHFIMPENNVTVNMVWVPTDVDFTVNVYKQNTEDIYIFDRTEVIKQQVDTDVDLGQFVDDGFEAADSIYGVRATTDGVYNLYLNRKSMSISYRNVDGEGSAISISGKAGSPLTPPIVSRVGYKFVGWSEDEGKTICDLPKTVPYDQKGREYARTYTAVWAIKTDLPYEVKHYVRNANDPDYTLYSVDYQTGYYQEKIIDSWNDYRNIKFLDGTLYYVSKIEGDTNLGVEGATVRLYYERKDFRLINSEASSTDYYYVAHTAEHGSTVDLTDLDRVPWKNGYKFVGWDLDGDGAKDEIIEAMPQHDITLTPLWEPSADTMFRVEHYVYDTYDRCYYRMRTTTHYGTTGTTPSFDDIVSDEFLIEGKTCVNYEKSEVLPIEPSSSYSYTTMSITYDPVMYNYTAKAYDPVSGEFIKEVTVKIGYDTPIGDWMLPPLSSFTLQGYGVSGYTSSGYSVMPDHDIEVTVKFYPLSNTPFTVNSYVEELDGSYSLYKSETRYGKADSLVSDKYSDYSILNRISSNTYYLDVSKIEDTYIQRDGKTAFNIYYNRNQVDVRATVHKLDAKGDVISSEEFVETYKMGEYVALHGYYPHYEFQKLVNHTTDRTVSASEGGFTVSRPDSSVKELLVDIYVTPVSGVPYTVNYCYEKADGVGYQIESTEYKTGSLTEVISSATFAKDVKGFTPNTSKHETITLDVKTENVVNVYYDRNVYTVRFINEYLGKTEVLNLKYGTAFPTPPTDTEYTGYDLVEWINYAGYEGQTVPAADVDLYAKYEPSSSTPYQVRHFIMGLDGESYTLAKTEDFTGRTDSEKFSLEHALSEYLNNGFSLRENNSVFIYPNGSAVLDIYYTRNSYTFSYHYYLNGRESGNTSVLLKYGESVPESINDYKELYPAWTFGGFYALMDGEYVKIDKLPETMAAEKTVIRVMLNAIEPEVTIVHKVMNLDGKTYTEERQTFKATPFAELDLLDYILPSANEGFTYVTPVNNQIPDALSENVYELIYNRNTYTIQYINAYQFEAVTEEYLYGATLGTAPVFERAGYVHSGWNGELPETMPARSLSLIATWQILDSVPVKVIHMMTALDGNGYALVESEIVYETPELELDGKKHKKDIVGGTYVSADKKVVSNDGTTEICVYYSRNEYIIRFIFGDVPGAGEDVVLKLPYESAITPPDFKVAGYEIAGWSPELPETMPAEECTYVAKWQVASAKVTVNHYVESLDGTDRVITETETVSAETGASLNGAAYQKTYEGFTYADADKNVTVMADGSTVINVYYTRNSYNVTFTYGDKIGEPVEHTVKYGAAIPTAPTFTVLGYIFAGWDNKLASTMPASNLTYAAQWTADTNVKFTVEHHYQNANDDGYTEVATEVKYGTTGEMVDGANYKKTLANAIFERAESKVIAADGSTVIKVYYVRTTHKITFTYGDKTGEGVEYTLRYGQNVAYNPSFSVTGYVFAGWDKQIPAVMPDSDVVINAIWNSADGIQYKVEHYLQNANDDDYKLDHTDNRTGVTGTVIDGATLATMVGNGIVLKSAESKAIAADGSTVIKIYYDRASYTVTYTYGDKIGEAVEHTVRYGATLPEAPVFSVVGYTFAGWDNKLASAMPASNLTYNATWEANTDTKFTVEHYYQNANDDNYTKVESEIKNGTTNSTVNGASFKKDTLGFSFANADSNVVILADGGAVVKVYYVRNSYKVTYTYGSQAGEAVEHTVKYGATLPEAPVFNILGYTFDGWDSALASLMPASNLTYNATWTANSDTAFTVEHYYQNAGDDGYALVESETKYGTTGATVGGADYAKALSEAIFERAESKSVNADGSTVIKVYYVRTSYTLTFTYGDKVGENTTYTLRYGQSISYNPSFSVVGYVFGGWDAEIPATMPAENITLGATWSAGDGVAYVVEHYVQNANNNEYTLDHTDNRTGVTGTVIDGTSLATLIGNGIVLRDAESKEIAADGSTVIKIYYDRASYTVTYTYGNKVGESISHTVRYGATLPEAPVFSVVGYTFAGWDNKLASTMPASNLTYNATWEANTDTKFTVEHYYQNANDDGYALVDSETKNGTTDATVSGADYAKALSEAIFERAESKTVSADGSTVIKVYYTRTSYKVTYTYGDKNGNAVEQTVRYGATLPEAPVFKVLGYTFAGWDNKLASAMPASNLTYNATWTANSDTKFTVEHYYQNAGDDGYALVESETKYGTTGATVNGADYAKALSEAIFERAESKTVSADGSTVIKVYYVRTSYTLTFTYGDKVGENTTYTLRYGQTVSYNPSFSVVGYVFAGWDAEIPATMPAQNVTINATWTASNVGYVVEHYVQNADNDDYTLDHSENRVGVTGTVIDGAAFATLVGNGIVLRDVESKEIAADGSTVIKIYYDRASYTVTYTYGDKVGEAVVATVRYGATLPKAPVFSVVGYTFAGWDSAMASTMPASNLTYNATWEANTDTEFTVEHYYQNANDDGYTKVDSETKYGTTASSVNGADYKKEFDEAIYEKADVATIAADGSTVIKVYYKRTTYTLTFSYDYVSQDEEVYTLRYGATLPKAPVFSAPGYIFNGWYDEEGCYVDEFAATMPASNLIYKAIWMEKDDTKFTVEHYIEQAGGYGYDLVDTAYGEGRTGSTIDDYWQFVLYDDGVMYVFERFNSEELVIAPDGSTVLKIYYQRVRYVVNFIVVDEVGNEVGGVDYVTVEFKYGQTITPPDVEVLEGYVFVGFSSEHDVMPEYEIEYYIVWRCIHECNDGTHQCEKCGEPLNCADHNDDGHCDYGREPMDPDDHRYVDEDEDHICDICSGSFFDLCFDNDKNGICDLCGQTTVCPVTGEDHVDEDEVSDHLCDNCGVWMSYLCVINDGKHECKVCYARFYDMCTDEDGDCWCDECIEPVPCKDKDNDGFCDVCENLIPCEKHVDEDQNALCDRCVENLQWCDEYDDMHRDENMDHLCDYCGLWLSYNCSDWTDDGRCEDCNRPAYCMQELGKNHADGDGDHYCDECNCWMSYVCTDADGDHNCDVCGNELKCFDHVDENQDAACDICGEETKCKSNPNATYHEDSGCDHVCDWCGVWVSIWCIDDDYNGYCDESGCGREFVCNHVDEDEDNYCDRCYRIINCTHESVSMHICDTCNQKVTDCYSEDGDLFCDECWEEIECHHEGTMDAHVCTQCYAYLSSCDDKDGDGQCDLSKYFPHPVQ